jgi:hypothetical protein
MNDDDDCWFEIAGGNADFNDPRARGKVVAVDSEIVGVLQRAASGARRIEALSGLAPALRALIGSHRRAIASARRKV